MWFASQFKSGHNNGDCLGINGFHAPKYGIYFSFQWMEDKVNNGLALSVNWIWENFGVL